MVCLQVRELLHRGPCYRDLSRSFVECLQLAPGPAPYEIEGSGIASEEQIVVGPGTTNLHCWDLHTGVRVLLEVGHSFVDCSAMAVTEAEDSTVVLVCPLAVVRLAVEGNVGVLWILVNSASVQRHRI